MTIWHAELRKAASPAVLVTAAVVAAVAAVMALYGYRDAYRHFRDSASVTMIDDPAGALVAASQQTGTFLGLAVISVLAGVLYADECQSGTWPSLLLSRPGRVRLIAVKICCALMTALAFTLLLGLLLLAVGQLAASVTGFRTTAGPGWDAAAAALAKGLVVQAVFAAMAFAFASLTRTALGTAAGTLGPVIVLAPLVGIDQITPVHPQAWAASWLRLQDDAQYSLYLWTREPSSSAVAPSIAALLALGAVHVGVIALASRGDRLFRPAD
ncbi:ABC transporter permease [Streptomyces sp. SCSIO 30461]|uniref:ABC transporter permease n=1 Tax=Streptomyces sp. SCSIO 30461 TaxID=3118085 RepID=UPI0030D460F1